MRIEHYLGYFWFNAYLFKDVASWYSEQEGITPLGEIQTSSEFYERTHCDFLQLIYQLIQSYGMEQLDEATFEEGFYWGYDEKMTILNGQEEIYTLSGFKNEALDSLSTPQDSAERHTLSYLMGTLMAHAMCLSDWFERGHYGTYETVQTARPFYEETGLDLFGKTKDLLLRLQESLTLTELREGFEKGWTSPLYAATEAWTQVASLYGLTADQWAA